MHYFLKAEREISLKVLIISSMKNVEKDLK